MLQIKNILIYKNTKINIDLNDEILESKEKEEKQFNNQEQKNISKHEENKELAKENDINEDKINTNSNDEDNELKEENIVIKNSTINTLLYRKSSKHNIICFKAMNRIIKLIQ